MIAVGDLFTTRRASVARRAVLGRFQNLLEFLHGEAKLLGGSGQVWGTLLWITQGIAQLFLRDPQCFGCGSQVERRSVGWMFTIGRLSVTRRLSAGWRWFAG
jgi:hypothetical protein